MTDPEMVVDCRNCGEPMPTDATRCPHCDAKVTTKPWGIGLVLFGLAVAGIFTVGGTTSLVPLENWQAGMVAGLFVAFLGVRLYRVRRRALANARPRGSDDS
ncbi:MAG: hypothetical protein ABEJ60_04450 [Halodesulfurarchaeum sp.]